MGEMYPIDRRVPAILAGLGVALMLISCIRPVNQNGQPWALEYLPASDSTQIYVSSPTPFMPGAQVAPQIFDTPTPNPPVELPTLRADSDVYIVQPGDTLMLIAQLYGISVAQILAANDLPNPDYLEVGQVLDIPAPAPLATGPGNKLIPDSELVDSPAASGFDVEAVVTSGDGFLARYEEIVDGREMGGAEIVAKVSHDFSVNPRLLLAVLEHQSGWLTRKNPAEQIYPIGLLDVTRKDLYRQLAWAADNLNQGYYLWRVGALGAFVLADGSIVPPDPTINAGTAGVQYFYARLYGLGAWRIAVSEAGLFATYQALFGYPFEYAYEPLLPEGLVQPLMQLPFEDGAVWNFTGGPHGGWADGSAWAALDFAPPGEALGCVQNEAWVVAVADGIIAHTGDGQVIQDLDGDGNIHTGWTVLYMHIEQRERVAPGTVVEAGDRLGHPSCEGGYSTGTHLHIARKYNGEWIPADQGNLPFVMDDWVSVGSGYLYDGWLTNGDRIVIADNGRSEENEIER